MIFYWLANFLLAVHWKALHFFWHRLLSFIFHKQNRQSQVKVLESDVKASLSVTPCYCFSFYVPCMFNWTCFAQKSKWGNTEILHTYTSKLRELCRYMISWVTNHSLILVRDFSVNIISQSCEIIFLIQCCYMATLNPTVPKWHPGLETPCLVNSYNICHL